METNGFLAFMNIAVIPCLKRLDEESRQPAITEEESAKRGFAVKRILDMVEKDFGTHAMMKVIFEVKEQTGHIPPLDYTILKKLVKHGCHVTNVSKVLTYKKA